MYSLKQQKERREGTGSPFFYWFAFPDYSASPSLLQRSEFCKDEKSSQHCAVYFPLLKLVIVDRAIEEQQCAAGTSAGRSFSTSLTYHPPAVFVKYAYDLAIVHTDSGVSKHLVSFLRLGDFSSLASDLEVEA